MATNILANGVDLDTLFKPRTNTKRADVGWLSNGGVDISNRFEKIGAAPPIPNTNLITSASGIGGNVDLAQLFMDINYNPIGPVAVSFTSAQDALFVGGKAPNLTPADYQTYPINLIRWDEPADAQTTVQVRLAGASVPAGLISSLTLTAPGFNYTRTLFSEQQQASERLYIFNGSGTIQIDVGLACVCTLIP